MFYRGLAALLLSLLASTTHAQEDVRAAQAAQKLTRLQPEIDAAIAKGAEYLISEQLLDGTWDFATGMYPSGQTALCVYTLLKANIPLGHAAVQQGLAAMLAREPRAVYATACQVLALEAAGDPIHLRAIEPLVDDLVKWQVRGLWSYPGNPGPGIWMKGKGEVDLSNTQFAMLALRAAGLAGIEAPERTYRSALDALPDFRGWVREGETKRERKARVSSSSVVGFRYEVEYRFPPTGSMTAGGVGCLKIALDALGAHAYGERRRDAEQLIVQGVRWLEENWTIVTNPVEGGELGGAGPGESWQMYFLYGLERLGAFLDSESIGGHFWFLEGARYLVSSQAEDGHYGERREEGGVLGIANRDLPDTCFAVLFLTRASHGGATLSGRGSKSRAQVMEETGSDVRFRVIGGNPMTLWVSSFSPRILELYGTGKVVHGLRVARVEYLVDGEAVGVVEGDPTQPWNLTQRFEHRHTFERTGARELRVRVGLVDPRSERAKLLPEQWIESFPIELEVKQVLEDWMVELAEIPLRNLLPLTRLSVESSSSDDPASGAQQATDGLFATRWLTAAADQEPWLRLDMKRGKRADTLLLCQAPRRASEAEGLARITRVRVRVNGAEIASEYELEANPLHPTAIPLPSEKPIKELEISIIGRDRGESAYGRVGFTEVSLEMRAPPAEDD